MKEIEEMKAQLDLAIRQRDVMSLKIHEKDSQIVALKNHMHDTPDHVNRTIKGLDNICENMDAHFFTMNYDAFLAIYYALENYGELLEAIIATQKLIMNND